MDIRFYNTLSGKTENFDSLKEGEVRMYTCGPTVYDFAHIGNFRTFVFEDLLRRFLEASGYRVFHVMNITDVDDKTIQRSNEEGLTLQDFTQRYTEAFMEDLESLHILPPNYPDRQPRATEEIDAMIELIRKLEEKEAAYEKDGSVYYRVSSFPGYGKLSRKNLTMNIAGARVDQDEYEKEEASDFVLWKKSRENEPSWDSPWGKGRPGWHLECSAMSLKYLGETFDIHAGGEDLIFPHHENEIAQSEAATGKTFVRYWLHSKHLLVNGEKMSKSKGNFFTLRDLAQGHDPMVIRYALLSVHYRQQMNFRVKDLDKIRQLIQRMDECYFDCLSRMDDERLGFLAEWKGTYSLKGLCEKSWHEVMTALADDLNVSVALSVLASAVREMNRAMTNGSACKEELHYAVDFFERTDRLLGLDISEGRDRREIPESICARVRQRSELRRDPQFRESDAMKQKADALRDALAAEGWAVKDYRPAQGSTVRFCRRTWETRKEAV